MDLEVRAAVAGVVAGLALAVPMGAISVLILAEALGRGWRWASAAATGVALVDLGYAAVATAAGTAVTRLLSGHDRSIRLLGAVVLLAVALHGLLGLRTRSRTDQPAPGEPDTATGPRPGAVLRRFVALTVINPLTAVYFVVLAAGLGSTVAGVRAGSAFVVGVFAGSWAWQLTLAGVGSVAGARLPDRARTVTGVVGYLMVIGYAMTLATGSS